MKIQQCLIESIYTKNNSLWNHPGRWHSETQVTDKPVCPHKYCHIVHLYTTQQTKLHYLNIITILSFAVFNISSAYYGNVAQENTTFTNITLPNNII